MAYNGSGTFSLSDTVANATTVDATELNAIFQDLADGLTAAVAKDGQSTLTGALKAADGSAASPSYTFGADTNTGLYRISADTIGVSVAGTLLATINSSGITLASGAFLGTNVIGSTAITANAVTLAKLATQADATVLANVSGGAAVPAAVGYTALFDDAFGSTQGTILYKGASDWAALATGTSGQFLKTQGAGANPAWATVIQAPDPASNTNKVVTSNGTTSSYSFAPAVRAAAYVSNAGAGTIGTGSFNVATAVRNSTGNYTVTFTTALANAGAVSIAPGTSSLWYVTANSASAFTFQTTNTAGTAIDIGTYSIIVAGGD